MSAFDPCASCGHSEFLHWDRGCVRFMDDEPGTTVEIGNRKMCGCKTFKEWEPVGVIVL